MYFDFLLRFSGRIVLSLLFAAVFLSSTISHYLGDRELLFIATVAAVYVFWIPARYLLSAAIGLLILAALLFTPLEEDAAEKLLRFVYYILIFVVSRELLNIILAPFPLTSVVKSTFLRLESYHYRTVAWLFKESILVLHSMRTAFVRRLIIYEKWYQDRLQRTALFWRRRVFSKMPLIFTSVMRGAEYISTPLRLLLRVRLIFFAVLTALVVSPWFLQPGYLFLLDYVWPPKLLPPILPVGFITGLPHEWVFWFTSLILPAHIVQKIVFALPLFLAGVSASQLVDWLLRERNSIKQSIIPSLAAGVFYALNPFVVSRVFMGQFYFLLAYALVPWAILATLWFLKHPSVGRGFVAGLAIVSVLISNAHHMILLPLIIVPLLIIRRDFSWQLIRRIGVISAPGFGFLILFFLVRYTANIPAPSFNFQGPWARLLQAPYTGKLWVDIATLTAHWKTDLLFAFPHESLSYFSLFMIILAALMGVGAWQLWNRSSSRWFTYQLAGIGVISFFLASGVSHPFTEPIAGWLYRHVPFWIGMRDSAKFIANLVFVETVLLGAGIAALVQLVPVKRLMSGLILILMLWFVSSAFGGFNGQILPVEYPAGWSQWNDVLAQQNRKPKMLVLPWHMYPRLAWLENRPVINPAAHFFTNTEAIVGDNSEVGGIGESVIIFSESTRPFSKKMEIILEQRDKIENLGSMLTEDNITYVALLADAVDIDKYQFLYRQEDLELILDSAELIVWKNTAL